MALKPRIARKIEVDGYLNATQEPRMTLTVGNRSYILDMPEIRQLMADIRDELEYIDRARG